MQTRSCNVQYRSAVDMLEDANRCEIWHTVTMSRGREQEPSEAQSAPRPDPKSVPEDAERPREYGGPKGPEPTRYGDWERAGRCIDF
jgi:hypothetical protein